MDQCWTARRQRENIAGGSNINPSLRRTSVYYLCGPGRDWSFEPYLQKTPWPM
jgi:hypothetical protein